MADLIDRDALEAKIRENSMRIRFFDPSVNVILHLIRYAPAVNRWIPCSKRLPEQGQRVIVQFRYNSAKNHTATSSAQRTYSGGWIVDVMRYADKERVTVQAWMPMPDAYEPPEKK